LVKTIVKEEYRIKAIQDANERMKEQVANLIRRQGMWQKKKEEDLQKLQAGYDELAKIDIEAELNAHQDLADYAVKKQAIDELKKYIAQNERDQVREQKIIDKLKTDIASLEEHKCHSCGQDLHDSNHEELLSSKKAEMQEAALNALSANTQYIENTDALAQLGELGNKPTTFYDREADAFEHRASLGNYSRTVAGQRI
jgi:DNA repair exonuclease SbcCD ATPase subunit